MKENKNKKSSAKHVYKKDYFPVGDGHELYYELYGNPKGQPVVFLHGGPGAGFSKSDYVFFNPSKFNVLFFDQRGSGKSKAKDTLFENTTKHLIEDIKQLMEFVGFEKAIIFGGSWGSCLSLLFAISHPQKAQGLVLRGIFLADKTAREHFYLGGIKNFFPKEWNDFISLVPQNKRNNPEKYYYEKMLSKDKKTSEKFVREWTRIEMKLLRLEPNKREIEKVLKEKAGKKFGLIECHFLSRNCFISFDYIKKNLYKIKQLPCSIVQGRYDMVCPPASAQELHDTLPHSKLFFTIAGHASREVETKQKLIEEVNRITKIV